MTDVTYFSLSFWRFVIRGILSYIAYMHVNQKISLVTDRLPKHQYLYLKLLLQLTIIEWGMVVDNFMISGAAKLMSTVS